MQDRSSQLLSQSQRKVVRLSFGLNLKNNIPTKWKYLNFCPIIMYQMLAFFSPLYSSSHHSSPAIYIPDSEDSGDVPAPISCLSLQMTLLDLPELVPEPVDRSAVRCPLLDQEGVCWDVSEATDDSESSCRSPSTVCGGTLTLSSGPEDRTHQQLN